MFKEDQEVPVAFQVANLMTLDVYYGLIGHLSNFRLSIEMNMAEIAD